MTRMARNILLDQESKRGRKPNMRWNWQIDKKLKMANLWWGQMRPSAPHLQLIGMQIPPVWLTNPPTTNPTLPPYKYIHCPIQIHSLWCTNPLLWGTNPGNWIRLMKTPPHTNAPLQAPKSQFKTISVQRKIYGKSFIYSWPVAMSTKYRHCYFVVKLVASTLNWSYLSWRKKANKSYGIPYILFVCFLNGVESSPFTRACKKCLSGGDTSTDSLSHPIPKIMLKGYDSLLMMFFPAHSSFKVQWIGYLINPFKVN